MPSGPARGGSGGFVCISWLCICRVHFSRCTRFGRAIRALGRAMRGRERQSRAVFFRCASPRTANAAPRMTNADPQTTNADPRMTNADPRMTNADPRTTNAARWIAMRDPAAINAGRNSVKSGRCVTLRVSYRPMQDTRRAMSVPGRAMSVPKKRAMQACG